MKHMRFVMIVTVIVLTCLTFTRVTAQSSATPNYVRAVVWNSNGDEIAIATEAGAIQILDTSGQFTRALQSSGAAVYTLAWGPDGTKLASAGADKLVRVWDIVAGKILLTLAGHTGSVLSVTWSPDGTKIASASYDEAPQNVRIWDAATGQLLNAISGGEAPTVAWSPNGSQFALRYLQGLEIRDAITGQKVKLVQTPEYGLFIAWSPDGTKIASADTYVPDKSVIRIWDANTGQLVQTLTGHTNAILSVSWSPDGTKLASAGHDGTIRLWDLATGQGIEVIQANGSVFRAAWSPYGGRLAYGEVAATTPNATATTASGLKLIVPPSTLKDLQAITRRCVSQPDVQATLMPDLEVNQLSAFVSKVKAASDKQIGPGCAADLTAVAEALQQKP